MPYRQRQTRCSGLGGLFAAAAVVLLFAPAGAQTEANEVLYARMNRDIVERHILPGYDTLARATADLAAAAESCDRRKIDPAYHAAMDAWMAVQHVAVGPVELMMRQPRLHFWPDSRNTGSRQLSQLLADRPEVSEETLAEGSVALQGFPALERILFEEGADGLDSYECGLAGAIAGNLATIAREVRAQWDGPDGETAMVLGASTDGSHYASGRDVSIDLYQGMYEALQAIVDLKLGRPLGDSLQGAHPRRAESWRSLRSLRNVAVNLRGLMALFTGDDGFGYEDALVEVGEDALAAELRVALDEAIAIADAIDLPLSEAVADAGARPAVEALRAALDSARELVGARMGAALGLQVGFNSLDGD